MTERIRTNGFRALLTGSLLLAGIAVTAAPAAAQQDARWLPWVGCWEAVDDVEAGGMLCIRPTAAGVEFLTVADGEVVSTETLATDGRVHVVEREGCEGEQEARFSSDDRRVFVTSELTCEGQFTRESTGLMAMTSPTTWIDVQVVDAGGRDMAWVRYYRPAAPSMVEEAGLSGITAGRGMALRTARYDAASRVTVEDVVEARDHVQDEAVKAWVAELREPFDLDAETLVALADAGVDPGIIDVMVAVSYPEHFVLDREGMEADRAPEAYEGRGTTRGYHPSYGYWGSRFFYDPFLYGYGYGAYGGYGGYYGGYYGYRPTVIVVSPTGQGPTGGRMVKGRGYTRPGSTRPSSGRGAVRTTRGSSEGASAGSSAGSTGSSSTGRKAKRRGGGGGDDGGGSLL